MKDGVIIVNTARGAVIDEEALAKALDNKVAVAGLDVYEFEPDYIHPRVLNHSNALLVPQMGTYTLR